MGVFSTFEMATSEGRLETIEFYSFIQKIRHS